MLKTFIVFVVLLFYAPVLVAQEAGGNLGMLTLKSALITALDNNFDIKIAVNESDQAKANNTAGNAGMLPTISAAGGVSGSITDAHIELATGVVQDRKGAQSYTVSGIAQLNWVLFDGMRMFVNKRKLEALNEAGLINWRSQIQATVAAVTNAYARVVREQQQLVAIDTAMSLAKVRMDIAKRKFEVGTSAKTDYLQAQVDYNASKSDWLTQNAVLRQAKDSLLVQMGGSEFADYDVTDSLPLNLNLSYRNADDWINQNFDMQMARQQLLQNQYDVDLANKAQLPTLTMNAAYNYNRTQNGAGVTLYNRTYGPQGSLSLNFPIFDGFNLQRQKKLAHLAFQRQDLIVQRLQANINAQYRTAWRAYENALKGLKLEQENIGYAAENVMIQQARFKVGVANTIELREAENSYVAALTRLADARFTVKITETRLLRLENSYDVPPPYFDKK
ncbi:MAG: TolC family protein [Edaphocola sp.]